VVVWKGLCAQTIDDALERENMARCHEFLTQPQSTTDMPTRFEARKQKILEQLDAPDGEYHDLSPKGSVDAPIRDLIGEINKLQGLVTTSSCSGRISVFLEGRKADTEASDSALEGEESRAGPGGKGGGGAWLFISHTPVERVEENHDLMSEFGLQKIETGEGTPSVSCRYIHLKFEPMVILLLQHFCRL
jgi:tRNA wybutosine-synthesizing protein 3